MELLLIVSAYLLGSVPSGYVLGKLAGVDVRKAGSGNVGATNVARVVGKRQGIMTLLFDVAKGFLPVLFAQSMHLDSSIVALTGVAAFVGHLYPIFLRFKGGKGVATALGVFVAVAPLGTMILFVVFAAVFAASRIVSLSSMVAAACAPVVLWSLSYTTSAVVMSSFIAVMIVWRHRGNIKRLLAGTEPRFGSASSR